MQYWYNVGAMVKLILVYFFKFDIIKTDYFLYAQNTKKY